MFKKIIVPTDGSEKALQAAQTARDIVEKFNSEVILLYVVQPLYSIPTLSSVDNIQLPVVMPEELEEIGKQALARTQDVFSGNSLTLTVRTEWGQPEERIVEVAKEIGADLIVIGSRGLNGLEELLMGSVSNHVVHHSPCPVLVIR